MSRTTIRITNRVTEAKRGRVRAEPAVLPNGSGRWVNPFHHITHTAHHPSLHLIHKCFPFWLSSSHHPHGSLGLIVGFVLEVKTPVTPSFYLFLPFVSIYRTHVNLFFPLPLSLCRVSRLAFLHIHSRKCETSTQCYRFLPSLSPRQESHQSTHNRPILCGEYISADIRQLGRGVLKPQRKIRVIW